MKNDLIVIEQLPIIRQKLEAISAEIDKKTADALALVCTEETVKVVKSVRAELNKDFEELEQQRKTVKKAVLDPYEKFESIYKTLISDKYQTAGIQLKSKIDGVENELKGKKEQEAREFFDELCVSEGIKFVKFEQLGLNINLSVTLKNLKEQITVFINKVNDDLLLIDTQEHKDEILVEYKRNLNVSKSITDVVDRHKELEEQKIASIEQEAPRIAYNEKSAQIDTFMPPPLEAPKTVTQAQQKLYYATFKVNGTIEQLKALKAYLVSNNITFENVPQAVNPDGEKKIQNPEPKVEIVSAEDKSDVIASVQFIDDSGRPIGKGTLYSYLVPFSLMVDVGEGVIVTIPVKDGSVKRAVVCSLGLKKDIPEDVLPKLKSITGIYK